MNNISYGKIFNYGFITGSQAFGTYRGDSDWDIVIVSTDMEKVQEIIRNPGVKSSYFEGRKMKVANNEINIIPVSPKYFKAWFLATVAMSSTIKKFGDISMEHKYMMFSLIREGFMGCLPTLKDYSCINIEIRETWKYTSPTVKRFLSVFGGSL